MKKNIKSKLIITLNKEKKFIDYFVKYKTDFAITNDEKNWLLLITEVKESKNIKSMNEAII